MTSLGFALVFVAVSGFIVLFVLWLIAENRWSKRVRIALGLSAILTATPIASLFAVAITRIDDQSYFATAVQTLLDETVAALDAEEPGFAHRLKTFRENQVLTYESRGNLLDNARAFRDEGQARRREVEKARSGNDRAEGADP